MSWQLAYELPDHVLTNEALVAEFLAAGCDGGWTAEKIFEKTGIAARHVVTAGETALDLAERAARKLFARGVKPEDVDFLLLCTQSPDYRLPSSACLLQARLGLSKGIGALDFDLGCSGFVYGLSLAKGLIAGGVARRVLLVTAETYSRWLHPQDRSVRTIFGDGAAAMLIDEAVAEAIGAFDLGTDGSGAQHLIVPTGGAREAVDSAAIAERDASGNVRTRNHLFMDGMEIFNFTLGVVPESMARALAKNGLTHADIDLYVFHQANRFMLETLRRANGLPRKKFFVDLAETGNTVSASIPIALARAEAAGALKPGMRVMVVGFGVGLSWGTTILHW